MREKFESKLSKKRDEKNEFGRTPVYICGSFNDWVAIELKTEFELRLE
jgi:hypothetical protein